ncbi:MAG: TIGR03016 family PEP-CTERM system-associated outer membrane protein [Sphingomonadales bacterium]
MEKHTGIGLGGVVAVVASALCLSGEVFGADIRVVPRVGIEEIYTDNVRLAGVREESDFVTNLSASLNVQGSGVRGTMALDYSFDYLYFADQSLDQFRNNLTGTTKLELVDDFLFMDAQASVSEQFIDRGGPISGNIGNITGNRRTVQAYNLSPSIRRRIGDFADFEARYGFRYFDADSRQDDLANNIVLSDATAQTARASLSSGRQFNRVKWQLLFEHDDTNRIGSNGSFESTVGKADVEIKINRSIAVLGSAGYERFRDQLSGFEPEGAIWDFGGRLTPGPRSRVSVRYGRRFDEMVWSVDGAYQMSSRTSVRFTYVEDLDTSQRGLGRRLGGIAVDDLGQFIDPLTGLPFDPADPAFNLNDTAFRTKRFVMALAGSRKRNNFSLRTFYELRERATGAEDEEARGISVNFTRLMNRRTTANLNFVFRRIEFGSLDRKDNFFGGAATVSYQLGERVAGRITYNLARRDSNRATSDFDENSVALSLVATF